MNKLVINIKLRYNFFFNISCLVEYKNSLVETLNNFLTENVNTYNFLNIKLESYNKDMINKVTSYIGDVILKINSRYKYGITFFEAIENDERFIVFLSHPNHWHYSGWEQFKKLVKIIVRKPVNSTKNFRRF